MAETTELVARLRERTAMRYMGDCKCGKCQLVPRAMIDEAADALERLSAPVEMETTSEERKKWKRQFHDDGLWPGVGPYDTHRLINDADKAARLQAEVVRAEQAGLERAAAYLEGLHYSYAGIAKAIRALLLAPKGDKT